VITPHLTEQNNQELLSPHWARFLEICKHQATELDQWPFRVPTVPVWSTGCVGRMQVAASHANFSLTLRSKKRKQRMIMTQKEWGRIDVGHWVPQVQGKLRLRFIMRIMNLLLPKLKGKWRNWTRFELELSPRSLSCLLNRMPKHLTSDWFTTDLRGIWGGEVRHLEKCFKSFQVPHRWALSWEKALR
jgi:hypothetical protein